MVKLLERLGVSWLCGPIYRIDRGWNWLEHHSLGLFLTLPPPIRPLIFFPHVPPPPVISVGIVSTSRECGLALDLGESELMLLETLSGAKPPAERADDRRALYGGDEGGGDGGGAEDEGGEEEEEEEESEAAKFCTAWLLCVGSATVGCMLAKVRTPTAGVAFSCGFGQVPRCDGPSSTSFTSCLQS